MDSRFDDNIDKVFKERFEDLKDHSVDPGDQWSAFNADLANSSVGAGAASSSVSGFSSLALAASFIGIIVLSTVLQKDTNRSFNLDSVAVSENELVNEQEIVSTTVQGAEVINEYHSESSESDEAFATSNSAPTTVDISSNSSASVANTLAYDGQNQNSSSSELVASNNDFTTDYDSEPLGGFINSHQSTTNDAELSTMEMLTYELDVAGVVEREIDNYEPSLKRTIRLHKGYIRGGFRTGNGESNAANLDSKWGLNALVSVGYAYSLTNKTFVTVEAGLLRRSGNAVERSKDIDMSPVYSVIFDSYGQGSSKNEVLQQDPMNVRESLIATRMDVLHIPVLVHVNLREKSNASVGFYADYLLQVKNKSYMVYNSTDYVSTDFGIGDERSTKGLNDWRLGLVAGYEHNLNDHLSADLRAMLPITSVYDARSEYYLHSQPNQLVDFQIALKYKI